jgi:hypothetical protein
LQQKIQAEASALEQSVKQATLTADQQVQKINEAVAKLSSPEKSAPGQTSQAAQPTIQKSVNPSATPPVNKSANTSE